MQIHIRLLQQFGLWRKLHLKFFLRYSKFINSRVCLFFLAVFLIIIIWRCKKQHSANIEKVVMEWVGREIIFPSGVRCSFMGRDTVCSNMNTPYKVLLYTDSVGCTTCKLQLYKWKSLIEEANSLMVHQISFLFYFHPKNEDTLQDLLKNSDCKWEVFIDNEDKLNMSNKLPNDVEYQCFLLNRANKVVLVGNPIMNPNIWNLYKKIIMGDGFSEQNEVNITTVELKRKEIELYDLKVNKMSTRVFILQNMGNVPLIIKDITTTCGCTVAEWEEHPIMPGAITEIKIKINPDMPGYFRKTVTVFCNTNKGHIKLIVKGIVSN